MISPQNIKTIIGKNLLADGMEIIIDLDKSKGSWLVDLRNGDKYLDCFAMFASMAVGFNHDKLLEIKDTLGNAAIQKPANSDSYSEPMAEFMQTFSTYAMPPYLPHVFFIEGGALAVENGLKAAFDWKVRKNLQKNPNKEIGHKIMHFRQAFHGRSGYTLSLTNTADPRKTKYFPKFAWPRIINPKITFPLNEQNLQEIERLEKQAIDDIKRHLASDGDDIAGLIIEPIQAEGGDNHFRNSFFEELRSLCDENDILFILDEIQTGVGLTGKFWAHEHTTIQPDILCFGKKTQVCGMLASNRIEEVSDNVFKESSRINSTFGGNLVDMVRCSAILKIIHEEKLVENARLRGQELLHGLENLSMQFPALISNPRGKGLMCAFDLENGSKRTDFLGRLLKEKVLLVGCGEKSVRFRPHLIISSEEIQLILDTLHKVLKKFI